VNIAVLPSNQPNYHITLSDGTVLSEQAIQEPCAEEIVAELKRQGHNAKMFFVAGVGTVTTDELGVMIHEARGWLSTFPAGEQYSISNHSDSGTGTIEYIYPQLCQSADIPWATKIGKDLAVRTGMNFRAPLVRTIMFSSSMKQLGVNRAMLFETGEHQTAYLAAYIWKYRRYDGIMIARSFIKGCGHSLINDGAVPTDVVVPSGKQFDKYRAGVVTPPVPLPPPTPVALPLLKATSPYMHDTKTGDFSSSYLITQYPIHWLQRTLNTHRTPVLPHIVVDGIYGPETEKNVKLFQAAHKDLSGVKLDVDGIVGPKTWAKLRTI
jgi:hypothetical protein